MRTTPGSDRRSRASDRRALNLLLTPRDTPRAGALVLFLVLAALAEGIGVGAIFPLLQVISNPDVISSQAWLARAYGILRAPSPERFVVLCSAALLLFFVLKNMFLAWVAVFQSRAVFAKESELGSALLRYYLLAPYEMRFGSNTAERVRIVTAEVSRVSNGVMLPLLVLIAEGLVGAMIVVVLFVLQPGLTLLGLSAFAAITAVFYAAFRPMIRHTSQARIAASSEIFRMAAQSLAALEEIKVFGREEYFAAMFARPAEAHARASASFAALNVMPRLLVEGLLVSGLLILVMVSVSTRAEIHEALPTLALFGLASIRMLPSVTRILSAVNTVRFYMPSVTIVATELERARAAAAAYALDRPPARAPKQIEAIELHEVSYRYPGADRDALQEVSTTFKRGEIVAIVGRSGSGKTTLGDIVLGLLKPVRGHIMVNGEAVRSLREDLGLVQGLVPQECNILDDTIRRNVAFGLHDEDVDDARVWKALHRARLDERVRAMPHGLDTAVGERGALLSGGERQRLGIARALYDDPDILVLDEATSALDPATEAEFMDTLKSLLDRKAIIVITHRVALVAWCDRVVVMSGGRNVGEGVYADLAARNASFAELVRMAETTRARSPDGEAELLRGGERFPDRASRP